MRVAIHTAVLNAFAERVLVRPILALQRFADKCDLGCAGSVVLIEEATAQQTDAHRAKITGTNNTEFAIASTRPIIVDENLAIIAIANKWHPVDAANRRGYGEFRVVSPGYF